MWTESFPSNQWNPAPTSSSAREWMVRLAFSLHCSRYLPQRGWKSDRLQSHIVPASSDYDRCDLGSPLT